MLNVLVVNKTRARLSALYDKLYKEATELIAKHDLCAFKNGTCFRKRSIGITSCCYGCKYLGAAGCSVKSLTCKLWFCPYIERHKAKEWESISKRLNEIMDTIYEDLYFFAHRGSKEDSINNAIRHLKEVNDAKRVCNK